jgi:energy-coupling factor transporter ATP-binding protein EcfA2
LLEKGQTKAKITKADISKVISLLEELRYPGLTPDSKILPVLAEGLRELLPAMVYKEARSSLWAVIMGGTGTGKSAIFNALCGVGVSASGVERPKTSGTIGYVHEDEDILEGFPFPSIEPILMSRRDLRGPLSGTRGIFQAVTHSDEALRHLVLVDTPDLDSLEPYNRLTAQRFSLLADVIVFVTSQEKYADETPSAFIKREAAEGKACLVILNKISENMTLEEIYPTLGLTEGRHLKAWLIPYIPGEPSRALAEDQALKDLRNFLLAATQPDKRTHLVSSSRRLTRLKAAGDLQRFSEQFLLEAKAASQWKERLKEIISRACLELVSLEEKRFASESRHYIKAQIKALFDRYDLLARPRRFAGDLILLPFKLLGIVKGRVTGTKEEILQRMKRRAPYGPLCETIERLNKEVLGNLDPLDEDSPLHGELRKDCLRLDQREIETLLSLQHQRLLSWLEEAFSRLSEGLSGSKKWGIYTTSVLWGILILALETVVGGGFTVLDAILGSALAPLVTKGAVEVFATQEIRKITRDLASIHKEGLVSVIEEQGRRYTDLIDRLSPPADTLEAVHSLSLKLKQEA